MPFPVLYLLDQIAPSETFIRREIELLRRRNWPIYTNHLTKGHSVLNYALFRCPEGFRWRFFRVSFHRISSELFRSPKTALRILWHLPQVADLIRKAVETESLLLHAHFAGITADLTGIAATTLMRPWTCSVHAKDAFTTPKPILFRRLRSARAVIACSQQAADAVAAAGLPAVRIHMIRHGLPLNDYPFDPIIPEEVIFSAGRFEPKKGFDILIHACKHLADQGVPFTCSIAGSGPLMKALQQKVETFDLEETLRFIGWLSPEEIRSRIMEASVVVLASRRLPDGDQDGIANILVEAMATGTPIVTTTASAAQEVLTDAINCRLVPPDDPEALAEAIRSILAAREVRARLAKAGRQIAETCFDGSATIHQMESCFADAVANAR